MALTETIRVTNYATSVQKTKAESHQPKKPDSETDRNDAAGLAGKRISVDTLQYISLARQ